MADLLGVGVESPRIESATDIDLDAWRVLKRQLDGSNEEIEGDVSAVLPGVQSDHGERDVGGDVVVAATDKLPDARRVASAALRWVSLVFASTGPVCCILRREAAILAKWPRPAAHASPRAATRRARPTGTYAPTWPRYCGPICRRPAPTARSASPCTMSSSTTTRTTLTRIVLLVLHQIAVASATSPSPSCSHPREVRPVAGP